MENEFFMKEFKINGLSRIVKLLGEDEGKLFWGTSDNIQEFPSLFITDSNLSIIEKKSYPNLQADALAHLVGKDSSNNLIIYGGSDGNGFSTNLKSVLKIDSQGNQIWAKTYAISATRNTPPIITSLGQLVFMNSNLINAIDINTGNIVNSYRLNINPSSIVVHNDFIYVIGSAIGTSRLRVFSIIKFDLNFTLLEGANYLSSINLSFQSAGLTDAFIYGNELIITFPSFDKDWFIKMDLSQSFLQIIDSRVLSLEVNHYRIFSDKGGGFYLMSNLFPVEIHRFDFNFNLLFSKRIEGRSIEIIFPVGNKILLNSGSNFRFTYDLWISDSENLDSNTCLNILDIDALAFESIGLLKEEGIIFSLSAQPFPTVITIANFNVEISNTELFVHCFGEVQKKIIQSPHLYLQAAGSTGADGTTPGIHLRWLLKNDLMSHLPKGNLAASTVNYNKPDDFVTLYRAPYSPVSTALDLSQPPNAVENRNALWLYKINGFTFYLYFRNKTKYDTVRSTINPLTQPSQFVQNYGSEVVELQSPNDLFFTISFTASSTSTAAKVETEILAVEENKAGADKRITVRKTYSGAALGNAKVITENGRSLRFRATNCQVATMNIELYSVLSESIENGTGWTEIGQFGLSENDAAVFSRLESTTNAVNSAWPRYNDDALVNTQNYKDKWSQQNPSTQSSIKETVQEYINLSDSEDNPTALESYTFDDAVPDGVTAAENSFELSNLMLLQQASLDYHVARMLGLGHLDTDAEVQNTASFVYMAVYQTTSSLVDGELIPEDTEHRFITVPTSRTDEKLPIALDLKPPVPGVFGKSGIGENNESLTDADGYTINGKSRFITLYNEEPRDLSYDLGFYNVSTEFNTALETFPVFAGIEYKKTGESDWRRPELPNTPDYQNTAPNGQSPSNETIAIPIPDEGTPLFVHKEVENGEHVYSSYGINWFSRIQRSVQEHALTTTIQPNNNLLPPSDRSALLVIEESPLLLTTANEQVLLSSITDSDKTLVRLLFNYNAVQELQSYKVSPITLNGATNPLDTEAIFPDNQEIFADEVEVYFRSSMPLNITGRAIGVTDHPTNEILAIITTSAYRLDSTGEDVSPTIPASQMSNFIGGIFVLEEQEYFIQAVAGNEDSPMFTVYKKQISDKLQKGSAPNPSEELTSPVVRADSMFLAVENLQNTGSWGTPNPHPLKIQIGDNWPIHREVITQLDADGQVEQYLQKTRGIWDNATIDKILQPEVSNGPLTVHRGQYKATFGSALLNNHPQNLGANPVQWYKGIIRIHTEDDSTGERRNLEVLKIENIGNSNALVVYFTDNGFSSDTAYNEIEIGGSISVNFYPGYRIYLNANSAVGLIESNILPEVGEGIKYTCFGFRTVNTVNSYYSRIAVPTVMFAQEIIAPLVPQLPLGALYATRPDSFGKATYTLTTQFAHSPHGVLYYRVDDDAILNAIYTPTTVQVIKQAIINSAADFLANRWQNLLSFDYNYPTNSFQTDGLFAIYPETIEGYRLPNPDNPALFNTNETPGTLVPGNITDRIKTLILENFVPLTEVPLLYEYINEGDYEPSSKKQVVRDRNGAILPPAPPGTSDFDIAPMAKKIGSNRVRFTDFTLDGTSNNLFFYGVKELSNTMQMSDFSPILGPVKLVNTSPPKKPSIRKVVPVLENISLGILPQMEVSVNAYPKVENIKKLSLYRALNPTDALSIRTMQLVKDINLDILDVIDENSWTISDEFNDLQEVPFGDPLYYRVTVSREIAYPDRDDINSILTEYALSETSKLVITAIVENNNPEAPELSFTSDAVNDAYELDNVVLSWEKSTYNPKYYVYKLNSQGQWVKIHEVISAEQTITLSLASTDLGSNILSIEDIENENQSVYHQFKVIVENTAGLLSQQDRILTIPDNDAYDGLGGMGVENTFIIR